VAVARLWFVISDLAVLNATYAASLSSFMVMFKHCTAAAPAAPTLQARLDAIEAFTISYIHRTVCRGLFEVHKLLLGFMMAAAKQREEGQVSGPEWDLLLQGCHADVAFVGSGRVSGSSLIAHHPEQPVEQGNRTSKPIIASAGPDWCPIAVWHGLAAAEASMPVAFKGICRAVAAETPRSADFQSGRSSCGADMAQDVPSVSWQHLLLYGQLSDFMPGSNTATSSSSSNIGSSQSSEHTEGELMCADGGRCLLDVLMQRDSIGPNPLQQQDQDFAEAATASPAQKHITQHTGDCMLTHPASQPQAGGLSSFQRLAFIKVRRLYEFAEC
jgi:hypothetical protein